MSMIEMNQVSFSYETSHNKQTSDKETSYIFKDLSLRIKKGQSVGLIGANGSGKSTLLKILIGLLPHSGEILVDGVRLEKKNLATLRQKMGFVFQDSNNQLFMPTVYDDLAFAPRNYGMTKEQVDACVDTALDRTGISHLKFRQNYKMSGGEKRMVCIATVLAMQPDLILMDEPSIALDPYNRRNLIRNLNQMTETKIIASHDLDMILETCDRVILLNENGIRADGEAEDILRDKALLESCRLELPFCMQEIRPYRR